MSSSGWMATFVAMGLSLAACGGDDDARATGVFAGPVIGLHYETKTQSGLTNAEGEFHYAKGETVTFIVGGVLLGTTPGAATVSAFDLFGLAPVVDVVALRQLLADRVVTPFDRAANVTFFLQALDDDRDPSNGIDITQWDATFAGQGLSFADDVWDFPYTRFQRFASVHGGIDRRLDPAAPLPHLYRQLGLSVAASSLSAFTADNDNDGVVDSRSVNTVDDLGRTTRTVTDTNGDGANDRDNTITYSPQGADAARTFRTDLDGDGAFERVEIAESTFDDDGNEVARLVQDTLGGVVGLKQTYALTYDVAGNLLTTQQNNDNGGNGSVESSARDTNTYDLVGRRVMTRRTTDNDGNGTPNRIDTTSFTWNDDDQMTSNVVANDINGDGVPDSTTTTTSMYDSAGNLTIEDVETLLGVAKVSGRHGVFTWDAAGHRLTSLVENDADGNGAIDSREQTTDTYTDGGLRLIETTDLDSNGDGTVDSRRIGLNTYDADFRLTATFSELDSDADGTVDNRQGTSFTYDAAGNMLTRHRQADSNLDGILELDAFETYAYAALADGLYALLFQAVVD